jgi:hypothetical protein
MASGAAGGRRQRTSYACSRRLLVGLVDVLPGRGASRVARCDAAQLVGEWLSVASQSAQKQGSTAARAPILM